MSPFGNKVRVESLSLVHSTIGGALPELEPIQDADEASEVFAAVDIERNCIADPCEPNLEVEFLDWYIGHL